MILRMLGALASSAGPAGLLSASVIPRGRVSERPATFRTHPPPGGTRWSRSHRASTPRSAGEHTRNREDAHDQDHKRSHDLDQGSPSPVCDACQYHCSPCLQSVTVSMSLLELRLDGYGKFQGAPFGISWLDEIRSTWPSRNSTRSAAPPLPPPECRLGGTSTTLRLYCLAGCGTSVAARTHRPSRPRPEPARPPHCRPCQRVPRLRVVGGIHQNLNIVAVVSVERSLRRTVHADKALPGQRVAHGQTRSVRRLSGQPNILALDT